MVTREGAITKEHAWDKHSIMDRGNTYTGQCIRYKSR